MSENKEAPKEKKEKKKAEGDGAESIAPVHHTRVKKNSLWTLERCQKFARRFKSEAEWAAGSPSSYKSAQSHGWIALCIKGAQSSRKIG
jgi:hypothetical protein